MGALLQGKKESDEAVPIHLESWITILDAGNGDAAVQFVELLLYGQYTVPSNRCANKSHLILMKV